MTRDRLREIIFEADTPAGKLFDVALILAISTSVSVVMLDSIREVRESYGSILYALEWFFTIIFTIEYVLRLYCIERTLKYARSFFGVVDLLAILPTYLSLFIPGTHYVAVIRILRVLRVFRILKFVEYVNETNILIRALRGSRRKITIFLLSIFSLVIILGSLMYLIEGEDHGFTSIPRGVYWAIVTLTTVGYGDISPQTNLGQALAAVVMMVGYSILAIPTGIFAMEINRAMLQPMTTKVCASCSAEGHDSDADFCKFCGEKL